MSGCRKLACLLLFLGILPAGLAGSEPIAVDGVAFGDQLDSAASVPEPATLLLAGCGLIAIAAGMRRRERSGTGGGSA
jgi:hypothetical protein